MRTVFKHPPDMLRLDATGHLYVKDGTSLEIYLQNWAKTSNITPETPINLIRHDSLIRLADDANLLHNLGA